MKIDPTLYKDEDIEARLNALPESIKDVLFHGNITQKIATILADEKLNPELVTKIRGTVTLIFLGMEYRSNLQKAVGEFLATDDEILTFRIADKIDSQLFKPISFILSKTYEDPTEPTLKHSPEEKHEDLPHRDSILSSIENPTTQKPPLLLNTDFSKAPDIKKTDKKPLAPGFMPIKVAPPAIPSPVPALATAPTPKLAPIPTPTLTPSSPMPTQTIQTMQSDIASPTVIAERKNLIISKAPETKEEKITVVPSTKPQPDPYRESF